MIDHDSLRQLRLFDANCRIGYSDFSTEDAPVEAAGLLAEMDRVGIAEALVYHASAAAYSPAFGNSLLPEACAGQSRLHRCHVVMPHHSGEMEPPAVLVPELLRAGARAVRMLPRLHRYSLAPLSCDALLAELERYRIPLFLDFGRTHWAEDVVDYAQVARICSTFPKLPVVLVREGIGSPRFLFPLFEEFDRLAIEISYYQPADGIEDVCRRFGARHLLFGTGLPDFAAGPAIAMLYYSDIATEDRCAIAGGNLRRLLAEVLTEGGPTT
jgi:hypothetical protein